MTSTCSRCGNGIGYPEIHETIHQLIDSGEIPNDPDPSIRNSMILTVMDEMTQFGNAFRINDGKHNFDWANCQIPIQRIDREIRHVLQPRKRSKKSNELEAERYEHHKEIKKQCLAQP